MTTTDPHERADQGYNVEADSPSEDSGSSEVVEIGKPCTYHEDIDPGHRISSFFKERMTVVDLMPCRYSISFSSAEDEDESIASGLLPKMDYEKGMSEYSARCTHHGVDPAGMLRVYTTDDTTSSDQFSNHLKENYFKTAINRASEMGDPLRDIVKSADDRSVSDIFNMLKKKTGLNNEDGKLKNIRAIAASAVDVIGKGHRLSLPSIWADSSYDPNFLMNIKLLSPYGDPEAIKEFVVKPLIYLLILGSPETEDGVSYGYPFFLTLKAYGMSYSPLAMISNMTMRRGGAQSHFSIYRQPLCIDVSIEFQFAVQGFAHHNEDSLGDIDIFSSAAVSESLASSPTTTALPTIGHIVKSLQPKK